MKRARARTSRSRFRLSRGPYTLFARFSAVHAASVRIAGRVCKSTSLPQSRALSVPSARPASSLSCFHGARRNIRQCRGVLAKLSVALGRLRFTRSCLASPRRAAPRRASPRQPGGLRVARNVDTSTCPRRGSAWARLGFGAHRTAARELEGRKREESIELYAVYARKRERENDRDVGMRAVREEERDIPRKAPTSETPLRAAPAGGFEPVAAVAAVNRAGALNPRRPRRRHRAALPASSLRVSLFETGR